MPEQVTLRFNVDMLHYKAGQVVKTAAESGVPLDKFLRRRLSDAVRDNCITVLKPKRGRK